MKMRIKFFKYSVACWLLSALVYSPTSFAQDWKKDLVAMNTTYLVAKSFSMDVVVSSFEKANDNTPKLIYKGRVVKAGDNYYTKMMSKTTIMNSACLLLVDDQQRMIMYKKNDSKTKEQSGPIFELLD